MMLGLIAGGLGALLAMRWMHWRRWRAESCGSAYRPHGMRRHRLRWLFRRLDATPGQEKVLLEAVEQVEGAFDALARSARGLPEDAARTVQGDRFEPQALHERFSRQDAAREELRRTLLGVLARVHEALEPDQRRTLARALDWGGRGGFGYGRC